MTILATQSNKVLSQYKSLRAAKTWGKVIGADHLFVVEITMAGSRPSLTILQSFRLSYTSTNFWVRE